MENFEKGETREVDEELPFASYVNIIQMKVTAGSKIKNVIGYALKKLKVLSWLYLIHCLLPLVKR